MWTDDDNSDPSLESALKNELSGLLAGLCEGILTDGDRERLNHLLNANGKARRYYLQYVAIHTALGATAGNPHDLSVVDAQYAVERATLTRFADSNTLRCAPDEAVTTVNRPVRWRSLVMWSLAASAASLMVAASLWWGGQRNAPVDTEALTASSSVAEGDHDRAVAEVVFVSDSAVWRNPNNSYSLASSVRAGQSLTLEHGQIELMYSTGTKLLLTGPTDFEVRVTGGKLRRGELVAQVPKAGHGFTIETPHGRVVDLGTEFGVVVDDFGMSQVSVFEGKVETLPHAAGARTGKIELTSGRAIQWTDGAVIPIHLQGRRYELARDEPRAIRQAASARVSLEEDFLATPSLPSQRWKTLGDVALTDRGLRLGAGASASQRPHLLASQEFDPSRGPVTVTCDVLFENAAQAEHASFAILTRCSDQTSKPGMPWHDMLAQSVRCRLMADQASGEGKLEAGTKAEGDRELTTISWGGFSRPQPGKAYRLEMRDDGLNVSFTVSLAENPAVRKTITCRSLFRGNRNFVALEGSSAVGTVVERVMISQSAPREEDRTASDSLATTDTLEDTTGTVDQDTLELLNTLSPPQASLVVTDDFDQPNLNADLWTTLGDVVLKGGQVQLGLPNADEHIDTWHARPYLLTRQQYDPAEGAIIILGRATFAQNFLHGYGGSFAVMTRGDNVHGSGPGWENSILRRGVRCNFWPAAVGFSHNLEIHEKPTANSILLAAATGFPISPDSRSYVFRVEDDGHSAVLSFVDAAAPAVRKTISHPTASTVLQGGHIGFESCWGSPVLLDNVRIFRLNPPSTPQ